MTNTDERKRRIDEILQMIKACSINNLPCDEDKLIATCMFKFGYTKRVMEDYIILLKNADQIEDRQDGLWIKDDALPTL